MIHLGEIHIQSEGRQALNEIRNYARSQSAGAINPETAGLSWSERASRERWSVSVVWPNGEVEGFEFDGSFGWPLNVKKAQVRFGY